MPTMLLRAAGREVFCSAHTIASSGLVMQMTKASGACALMPAPTASITLRLMPSRSSRLMPGLRGTPAVTMIDVGAGDVGVVAGARQLGVEALDRGGFGEIERLALRHAVDDVEQDDVAEFLHARPDAPACRRSGRRRSGQSSCAPWVRPRLEAASAAFSGVAILSRRAGGKPNFWPDHALAPLVRSRPRAKALQSKVINL